jgi:hypothetical protein
LNEEIAVKHEECAVRTISFSADTGTKSLSNTKKCRRLSSFMNVQAKGHSQQWMHAYSPTQKFKTNACLPACCVLKQKWDVDGRIRVTREHTNMCMCIVKRKST